MLKRPMLIFDPLPSLHLRQFIGDDFLDFFDFHIKIADTFAKNGQNTKAIVQTCPIQLFLKTVLISLDTPVSESLSQ